MSAEDDARQLWTAYERAQAQWFKDGRGDARSYEMLLGRAVIEVFLARRGDEERAT